MAASLDWFPAAVNTLASMGSGFVMLAIYRPKKICQVVLDIDFEVAYVVDIGFTEIRI